MTIATRYIHGNNSGPYLRRPKVVVMHSTRSTIASKTDAQELESTLNWFTNPNGASSHWVLSELERVRVVTDDLIAWHSSYFNPLSWGVELTQPTIDRPFTDGHYDNASLVGQRYVKLGVAPVWLSYWDGDLDTSGFVAHQDTKQGRESGKSDPGPEFDSARFIAGLEETVTQSEFNKMYEKAVSEYGVRAINDAGNPVGSPATVALYLYRIRQLQAEVKLLKQGTAAYTDERAVKAVKDAL